MEDRTREEGDEQDVSLGQIDYRGFIAFSFLAVAVLVARLSGDLA